MPPTDISLILWSARSLVKNSLRMPENENEALTVLRGYGNLLIMGGRFGKYGDYKRKQNFRKAQPIRQGLLKPLEKMAKPPSTPKIKK